MAEVMNQKLKQAGLLCLELLHQHGAQAWWVGGCVRDRLLGRPVKDIDITTNSLPQQTLQLFQDAGMTVIPSGLKHGTLTVMVHRVPVEITVYRSESDYLQHRYPRQVRFVDSLQQDCARRDFTINALCWNPREGIRDFFGGQQDLKQRRIRCIGQPHDRFNEDTLRILRALRFSSVLGFTIEPQTAQAMNELRELLHVLSAERIAREMELMAAGDHWPSALVQALPVLRELFPYLPLFQSETAWQSALDYARQCPPDSILRLCGLFLDAQPDRASSLALRFARQLKWSTRQTKRLTVLCAQQRRLLDEQQVTLRWLLHDLEENSDDLITLQQAAGLLEKNTADHLHARLRELRSTECLRISQLAVSGHDLQALGCLGAQIGQLLQRCLEAVLNGQIPNEKEALLSFCQRILQEG